MNTAKRARLAAMPIGQLNLASQRGQREFRRRMARKAADFGNSWAVQTGKPVNKPNPLKNRIGQRPRWRWVPKEKGNL
jgi:hypothetical protein